MQITAPLQVMSRVAQTMAPASPFVDFCAQWAPMASLVVFLAPLPTARDIRSNQSVGSLPLLPYTSMVASSFLWATYGYLKHEPTIYQPNLIGFILGLVYFVNFLAFSPRSSPTLPGAVTTHTQGILGIMMATLFVASNNSLSNPVELIGKAGVIMCVAMFASPLSALKSVVTQKSAQAIPLPFTIASLINCLMWSITGLYKMSDVNVYLPNLLGLSFSIAQVVLKLVYGSGPKKVDLPI
jgi:solute carrier family 50 (sugar transporter)